MNLSFKELSGSTRLFLDYLFDYPQLSEFFSGDFSRLDSYRGIAEQVGKNRYPRAELAALLTDQNREFGATSRTLENINLLKDSRTNVVFTGQQIGLFGGPLYTIYKSLTLIKLAGKLESELKTKVIPIFWMATDDHDFVEINHIFFSDRQDKLVKLEYQPEKNWSGCPASQIILDKNILATLEILRSGLKSAKFTQPVLEKLSDAYQPGRPYHLAFARWMTLLLGKFGLIILNPADPRFKTLLKPIFKSELEMDGNLQKLIEQTSRILESKNYHRQVRRKDNLTNLFYHSPHRVNVTKENGSFGWQGNDRKLSGPEIIKILDQTPQNFSANVLLRPVLESFLFPNLAHVAGPSEIAYFAQTKSLHEEFRVTMPVVYPRRSLTLIEPEVKETLARYNVLLPELNRDVEAVYSRLIEAKLP
ncbi:MAG: bacillithiol biosynthesis cysteine-adding enzyme BshC, partial [candidate division Zixibacteria bacterium]|nr:bacillithiol biosynthesis cysteine-adding enzyme BshC [candidate division Zixibacteria bacterium]